MLELLQTDYELDEMDEMDPFLTKKTQAVDLPQPRRDGLKVFLLYI